MKALHSENWCKHPKFCILVSHKQLVVRKLIHQPLQALYVRLWSNHGPIVFWICWVLLYLYTSVSLRSKIKQRGIYRRSQQVLVTFSCRLQQLHKCVLVNHTEKVMAFSSNRKTEISSLKMFVSKAGWNRKREVFGYLLGLIQKTQWLNY